MNPPRPAPSAGTILVCAIVLGVLGDFLSRPQVWGLNVLVGAACLVGAAAWLYRSNSSLPRPVALILGADILLLGLGYVSRSGADLRALDLLGIAVAMALALTARRAVALPALRVMDVAWGFRDLAANTFRAPPALVGAVAAQPTAGARQAASKAALGALLAVPLLFVFGVLFADADPVFATAITNLFNLDLESAGSHAILTACWGAGAAGMLWGITRWTGPARAARAEPAIGAIETATGLGLVALLCTIFVGLQVRYLFGGAAFVLSTAHVTYAQYARQGFFQLVTVVGIGLPLLLVVHRPAAADTATRLARGISAVMIALLGLIAASAAYRLGLYASMYGLTEMRIVAGGATLWLIATLAWFALTVQRDRPEHFVVGSGIAATAILALLHIANPDGWAMRTQVARAARGATVDARYLAYLGGDAVPPLAASLADLPAATRCAAWHGLVRYQHRANLNDWRSWTLPQARAMRALRAHATDLSGLAGQCPAIDEARPTSGGPQATGVAR